MGAPLRRLVSSSAWAALALLLACTGDAPRGSPPAVAAGSLLQRAEVASGLRWHHPVEEHLVSGAELADRVAAEYRDAYEPGELDRAAAELVALGLAAPGIDLLDAVLELSAGSTLGFYSSLGGVLFIDDEEAAGSDVDPVALRVHELTHALQDQNTVIPTALLGLREQDDLAFALATVLEGHALDAETNDAVQHGLRTPVQVTLADVGAYRAAFSHLPALLVEGTVGVYPAGAALVRAARADDGARAVQRLLDEPPLSSEQVLTPAKWLPGPDRDPPRFIELPRAPWPAGCEELARNTLGRFALGLWLEARLGVDRATADGWDGDRYVLLDCRDGARLAWAFELDDEAAATRLGPRLVDAVAELDGLVGGTVLRRDGRRLLVTRGLAAPVQEKVWDGTTSRDFPSLDALLAADPSIRARASRLREHRRTAGSHEQGDADGRGDRPEPRGHQREGQLRAHVIDEIAAGEHARQDRGVRDR
jgi:hypothetical protein